LVAGSARDALAVESNASRTAARCVLGDIVNSLPEDWDEIRLRPIHIRRKRYGMKPVASSFDVATVGDDSRRAIAKPLTPRAAFIANAAEHLCDDARIGYCAP